jgi:hypothetical protein
MGNIFEAAVQSAMPWYVRHWRTILVVLAAIVVTVYINVLQGKLDQQAIELKTASDALVRATTQYQSDLAYLKASIYKQNLAITEAELAAKQAKTELAYAATKSSTLKANADRQVNQILQQPKPANADAAITSLVVGVSYLQWDQIK